MRVMIVYVERKFAKLKFDKILLKIDYERKKKNSILRTKTVL